jgi:hypothetical protein
MLRNDGLPAVEEGSRLSYHEHSVCIQRFHEYTILFYAQQRMVGRVPGDSDAVSGTEFADISLQKLCWMQ